MKGGTNLFVVLMMLLDCLLPLRAFALSSGVNSCGVYGTNLASGATTPICPVTLTTRGANPVACQTVVNATIRANHGAAASAQLIVGVSNLELGRYPMKPYLSMVHTIYIPQIYVPAGQTGALSDSRIDAVVDDTYYGGSNAPGSG